MSLGSARMPGDFIPCLRRATMLYIPRFCERSNDLWAALPPLAPLGFATEDGSHPHSAFEVLTPVPGCLYHSPIEVIVREPQAGVVLLIRLLTAAGNALAAQITASANPHGFFHLSLDFDDQSGAPGRPQPAVLEFREVNAQVGRPGFVHVPIAIASGPRAVNVLEPTAGATAADPIRVQGSALAYEGTVCILAETRFGQRLGRALASGGVFDHARFTSELHVATVCPEVLVSVFAPAPGDYKAVDPVRIPVFIRCTPGSLT